MSTEVPMDDEQQRFNSLTAVKAAHTTLLKNYKDNDEAQLDEIDHFVRAAAATGALLDCDNDRYAVQSLIDYWITILYRGKRTPPDATLVEFDPSLLPELDDSLCPYRGLNAFQEADRDIFFGRQRLLEILVKKITANQVLFVVGPSGSGKSSLVLAGLVPELKKGIIPGAEKWQYIPAFVPSSDPLRGLAWALAKAYAQPREWVSQQVAQLKEDPNHLAKLVTNFSPEPTVIVIDQFEEVFTLCLDDGVRDAFVNNLLSLTRDSSTRHQIILTLRTDYETYLAPNAGLMSLFEDGQVRVMPLTSSELRTAIEEPAKRINLRFEDGVVDSLVKDILGEPEGLPLLQFTLLRLWKTRENGRNRITLQEYRKLGGARRALALTADDFYQRLTEANRITLRRIMLRLALPSGNAEVLRNTVKRETLYFEDPRRVNDVLDGLAEEGLIRVTKADDPKNDKVQIAHEALVRHWPTLVGWIDKERVAMRQRLRLTSAAQQWFEHGKDEGALLGGSLLAEALKYEALNDLEKEFVAASQEAVDRVERQKEQEQRLRTLRLRQFASVVTVLLVFAIGAAVFGLVQTRQAWANENVAKEQASIAQQKHNEAVKQSNIAKEEREEAELQKRIAEDSKADMEEALLQARKAEALARKESVRARVAAQRAIRAQHDADKYSRLYLELYQRNEQELELRKQRDEASANLESEKPDVAIDIYRTLLDKYKTANNIIGQAEIHSELSRAYEKSAERAGRKNDKPVAETNRAKAITEYDAAVQIYEAETKKEIDAPENDKDRALQILFQKAQFYRNHSKDAEVEKTYLQAMAIQEEALTTFDLRKVQTYDNIVDNLVVLYRVQANKKLEDLYQTVLDKKRKLYAQHRSGIYELLREVAAFSRKQKRFTEAENLYREALDIVQETIKNEKDENDLISLDRQVDNLTDLAETYYEQGKNAIAEEQYRKALEKQQQKLKLLGAGNDGLPNLKVGLANTLKAQGKDAEAVCLYDEAVKRSYAEGNVTDVKSLTISLESIAEILQKQNRPEKIEQRYKESLAAFQGNEPLKNSLAESLILQAGKLYESSPKQPPQQQIKSLKVAESLISLAFSTSPAVEDKTTGVFESALRALREGFNDAVETDNAAEIENLFNELLDTKERALNAGERRVGSSLEQLLPWIEKMYRSRDEQKLAVFYKRALAIRAQLAKVNGSRADNPSIYATHNELAKLQLRLGRNAEAKETYTNALGIVERRFGKNNGSLVVESLANLATAHVALKEYGEAEKLYIRARTNLETSKRDKTVKMAEVLEAYASILKLTGRTAESVKLVEDAQGIRSKLTTSAVQQKN